MDHVHFEKGFFVCVHTCTQSLSNVQLFLAHGLQPARLLYPWNSPGKITTEGCHFLLQGIFLSQGLNLYLLYLLHFTMIQKMYIDRFIKLEDMKSDDMKKKKVDGDLQRTTEFIHSEGLCNGLKVDSFKSKFS